MAYSSKHPTGVFCCETLMLQVPLWAPFILRSEIPFQEIPLFRMAYSSKHPTGVFCCETLMLQSLRSLHKASPSGILHHRKRPSGEIRRDAFVIHVWLS